IFLDITPAPPGIRTDDLALPGRGAVEQFLYENALSGWAQETSADRSKEVERVAEHVRISLDALIDKQNLQLADLCNQQIAGQTVTGLGGRIPKIRKRSWRFDSSK